MAMGNDPVNRIDPDGMRTGWLERFKEWWDCVWKRNAEGSNLKQPSLDLTATTAYTTKSNGSRGGGSGGGSGGDGGGGGSSVGGGGGGSSVHGVQNDNTLASLTGQMASIAPNPYRTVIRHNSTGGGIDDPRFPGVKIYYDEGREWGYYLPGNGIHVPPDASTRWIQHEYGHYLQYMWHGPIYYYLKVVVESGGDAALNQIYLSTKNIHNHLFVEMEANTLAHIYFGATSRMGTKGYPIFEIHSTNNFLDGMLDFFDNFINTFQNGINSIQNWNGIP